MRITSLNWWLQMFMSTLLTMVFMYIIKLVANKVNVPVVSDMVNAV